MNTREYLELTEDAETQRRHVSSLEDELAGERRKLVLLDRALRNERERQLRAQTVGGKL